MISGRSALFGGALLTAGISSAQQFDFALNGGGSFNTSYTLATAYSGGLGSGVYNRDSSYQVDVLPADQTAEEQGWGGFGSVSATRLLASATGGPEAFDAYAYGNGRAYAYVNQSVDTELAISWDFSNEIPGNEPQSSFLTIFNWDSFETVFSVNPGVDVDPAFSGSASFTLLAGVNYGITLSADVFEAGGPGSAANGTAFAEIVVVPGVGVLGLAGVSSGLVGIRRRR